MGICEHRVRFEKCYTCFKEQEMENRDCKCGCHRTGQKTILTSNPPQPCCNCDAQSNSNYLLDLNERLTKLEDNQHSMSQVINDNKREQGTYIDDAETDIMYLKERIEKLEVHHVRQIDENRKVFRELEELAAMHTEFRDSQIMVNTMHGKRLDDLAERIKENVSTCIHNNAVLCQDITAIESDINLAQQNPVIDSSESCPCGAFATIPECAACSMKKTLGWAAKEESSSEKPQCIRYPLPNPYQAKCPVCENEFIIDIVSDPYIDLSQQAKLNSKPVESDTFKKTKTYWVNVYNNGAKTFCGVTAFDSEEQARIGSDEIYYSQTISFQIEVEE